MYGICGLWHANQRTQATSRSTQLSGRNMSRPYGEPRTAADIADIRSRLAKVRAAKANQRTGFTRDRLSRQELDAIVPAEQGPVARGRKR